MKTRTKSQINPKKRVSDSKLPAWNLKSLFSSLHDPEIQRTINRSQKRAEQFRRAYAGKVGRVAKTPKLFLELLKEYEALMQDASKPYHYASLLHAESATAPGRGALLQHVRIAYVRLSNTIAFFSPELLALPQKELKKLALHPVLGRYRNHLLHTAKYQQHELPEREKQIFSDLSLSGNSAVIRMFDEEFATRLYQVELPASKRKGRGGSNPKPQTLTLQATLDLLHNNDRGIRKAAGMGFSKGLQEDSRRITLIFNTLLLDKQVKDSYHHFENPEDSRHLENQIERKAADSLVRAVRQSYREVAKFYKMKRELLGLTELFDYDRYAPVSERAKIPWNTAVKWVSESFHEFHPEFGRIADEFFHQGWVDAADRPGKRSGAFCSFVTPDLHPYVFMNYGGTKRDVFTLAHELGHAIHAYLMREQSYLNFDTPLTIAETASVFAELLLFQYLLARCRTKEEEISLRVHQIENLIATVHRQSSMFLFERDLHDARRKGELSTEQINALWRARQEEMFQGGVTLTKEYDYWWSYIPHFVHTPFYVYAYAFGQLLALGLQRSREQDALKFSERYLQFLRAGNSLSPEELGKIFHVRLSQPEIWQDGVKTFRGLVKELEGVL